MLFAAILALTCGQTTPSPTELTRAADPSEVVFVPDLEGRDSARSDVPPATSQGKLVLVTDLGDDDPYFALVTKLAKAKQPAAILRCAKRSFANLREEFVRELPEFAWIITRPDHLDVNVHFDLVEMLTTLDADPFVDVAFGYLTGATLEEADAFATRALAASSQPLPKLLLEFGPAAQQPQTGGPMPHPVAPGIRRWFDYHGPVEELKARLAQFRGKGVIFAAGHGLPTGIDDGLQARDLRDLSIDFDGALYVSGPCYCGVTGDWFDVRSGRVEKQTVTPLDSFALAVLARGASALLAGFDPDRAEQAYQELEHLWIHADALGHAAKSTYDGAILAQRLSRLSLHRYQDGAARPERDLDSWMIGCAVSRALFGDPTNVPWKKPLELPFGIVKATEDPSALHLKWSTGLPLHGSWNLSDVYRCDGTWTHRIQFRQEIDDATARALESFHVLSVRSLQGKGKDLPYRYATAMIERWLGKAYLHVYLVFPPAEQQNTFFVERFVEAQFEFRKRESPPPR